MMKNWLPFVLGWPAFAIASAPGSIFSASIDLVVEVVAGAAGAVADADRRPGS